MFFVLLSGIRLFFSYRIPDILKLPGYSNRIPDSGTTLVLNVISLVGLRSQERFLNYCKRPTVLSFDISIHLVKK